MHYALQDCKRLLHYDSDYDFWMQTPNERLRFARRQAGYETSREAAVALGMPEATKLLYPPPVIYTPNLEIIHRA